MTDNQQVTVYSFGFTFDGILFCWKKKELYRMPYSRGNRNYKKRKLSFHKSGGSYGYSICGKPKSMTNLEDITTNIHHKEVELIAGDCPF
jgi:hypothetical protein